MKNFFVISIAFLLLLGCAQKYSPQSGDKEFAFISVENRTHSHVAVINVCSETSTCTFRSPKLMKVEGSGVFTKKELDSQYGPYSIEANRKLVLRVSMIVRDWFNGGASMICEEFLNIDPIPGKSYTVAIDWKAQSKPFTENYANSKCEVSLRET